MASRPETVAVPHYSPEDAVLRMQEAGIVGAGGAGFPAHVKFRAPPPALLVNGAESEAGYYTDKLLFREHPCEYALLFRFLRETFGFEEIIVAVEEMAAPWMDDMQRLAASTGAFEVQFIPNRYALGQERALTQHVTGRKVGSKERPQSVGVVVSNNETLWNIYRALFESHPVTTKMVSVFGETPVHAAFEAPIGTYARDLVALAGLPTPDPDHVLYDGGPVLNAEVPTWLEEPYGVKRSTNGLLVVSRSKGRPLVKHYPIPGKCPEPTTILDVSDEINRVRIPLDDRYAKSAPPTVHVGEFVEEGDLLAPPLPEGLSVAAHASIPGIVAAVTDRYVDIERG